MNRSPVEIDFRLLGPFQVYAGGQPVKSPRPQVVALLAKLLTADAVGASRDTCKSWAFDSTHVHNDRLNELAYELGKWLEPLELARHLRLDSRTGQRFLDVPKHWVDVHRFHNLISEADAALPNTPKQAADGYREAIRLFRGDPLLMVPSTDVDSWRTGLRNKLRATRIKLAKTELELGNGQQVVDELTELHGRNPVDPDYAYLCMYALAATGNKPAAMEVYKKTVTALRATGMTAEKNLNDLYGKILNGEIVSEYSSIDETAEQANSTKNGATGTKRTGRKITIGDGSEAIETDIESSVNIPVNIPNPDETGDKIAIFGGYAAETRINIRSAE